MRQDTGFFSYRKWTVITNHIPYMRWSQAWMLFAISKLIGVLKNEKIVKK